MRTPVYVGVVLFANAYNTVDVSNIVYSHGLLLTQ